MDHGVLNTDLFNDSDIDEEIYSFLNESEINPNISRKSSGKPFGRKRVRRRRKPLGPNQSPQSIVNQNIFGNVNSTSRGGKADNRGGHKLGSGKCSLKVLVADNNPRSALTLDSDLLDSVDIEEEIHSFLSEKDTSKPGVSRQSTSLVSSARVAEEKKLKMDEKVEEKLENFTVHCRDLAKFFEKEYPEQHNVNRFIRTNRSLICKIEDVRVCPPESSSPTVCRFMIGEGRITKSLAVGYPLDTAQTDGYLPIVKNMTEDDYNYPEEVMEAAKIFEKMIQYHARHSVGVQNLWQDVHFYINEKKEMMMIGAINVGQALLVECQICILDIKKAYDSIFKDGMGKKCKITTAIIKCDFKYKDRPDSVTELLSGDPRYEFIDGLCLECVRMMPNCANQYCMKMVCRAVEDLLSPTKQTSVLDIYDEMGLIALYLSKIVGEVLCYDDVHITTVNTKNVAHHNIDNVTYFNGDPDGKFMKAAQTTRFNSLVAVFDWSFSRPQYDVAGKGLSKTLRRLKQLEKIVILFPFKKKAKRQPLPLKGLCGKDTVDNTEPFFPVRAIPIDTMPFQDELTVALLLERDFKKDSSVKQVQIVSVKEKWWNWIRKDTAVQSALEKQSTVIGSKGYIIPVDKTEEEKQKEVATLNKEVGELEKHKSHQLESKFPGKETQTKKIEVSPAEIVKHNKERSVNNIPMQNKPATNDGSDGMKLIKEVEAENPLKPKSAPVRKDGSELKEKEKEENIVKIEKAKESVTKDGSVLEENEGENKMKTKKGIESENPLEVKPAITKDGSVLKENEKLGNRIEIESAVPLEIKPIATKGESMPKEKEKEKNSMQIKKKIETDDAMEKVTKQDDAYKRKLSENKNNDMLHIKKEKGVDEVCFGKDMEEILKKNDKEGYEIELYGDKNKLINDIGLIMNCEGNKSVIDLSGEKSVSELESVESVGTVEVKKILKEEDKFKGCDKNNSRLETKTERKKSNEENRKRSTSVGNKEKKDDEDRKRRIEDDKRRSNMDEKRRRYNDDRCRRSDDVDKKLMNETEDRRRRNEDERKRRNQVDDRRHKTEDDKKRKNVDDDRKRKNEDEDKRHRSDNDSRKRRYEDEARRRKNEDDERRRRNDDDSEKKHRNDDDRRKRRKDEIDDKKQKNDDNDDDWRRRKTENEWSKRKPVEDGNELEYFCGLWRRKRDDKYEEEIRKKKDKDEEEIKKKKEEELERQRQEEAIERKLQEELEKQRKEMEEQKRKEEEEKQQRELKEKEKRFSFYRKQLRGEQMRRQLGEMPLDKEREETLKKKLDVEQEQKKQILAKEKKKQAEYDKLKDPLAELKKQIEEEKIREKQAEERRKRNQKERKRRQEEEMRRQAEEEKRRQIPVWDNTPLLPGNVIEPRRLAEQRQMEAERLKWLLEEETKAKLEGQGLVFDYNHGSVPVAPRPIVESSTISAISGLPSASKKVEDSNQNKKEASRKISNPVSRPVMQWLEKLRAVTDAKTNDSSAGKKHPLSPATQQSGHLLTESIRPLLQPPGSLDISGMADQKTSAGIIGNSSYGPRRDSWLSQPASVQLTDTQSLSAPVNTSLQSSFFPSKPLPVSATLSAAGGPSRLLPHQPMSRQLNSMPVSQMAATTQLHTQPSFNSESFSFSSRPFQPLSSGESRSFPASVVPPARQIHQQQNQPPSLASGRPSLSMGQFQSQPLLSGDSRKFPASVVPPARQMHQQQHQPPSHASERSSLPMGQFQSQSSSGDLRSFPSSAIPPARQMHQQQQQQPPLVSQSSILGAYPRPLMDYGNLSGGSNRYSYGPGNQQGMYDKSGQTAGVGNMFGHLGDSQSSNFSFNDNRYQDNRAHDSNVQHDDKFSFMQTLKESRTSDSSNPGQY